MQKREASRFNITHEKGKRKRTSVATGCPMQVLSDLKLTRDIISNLTQNCNQKKREKR